jgi:hypothetical protein
MKMSGERTRSARKAAVRSVLSACPCRRKSSAERLRK